jgi:hypothetical protein
MAAHIDHPTSSRRFIKLYLSIWALLASGALAYLAVLAFPPSAEPPAPRVSIKPEQSTPAEVTVRPVKTSEVKDLPQVQGSASEVRKDVSPTPEAAGDRAVPAGDRVVNENEKVVQTPSNPVGDRVAAIDGPQAPSAAAKVPGISVFPTAGLPPPAAEAPLKPADEAAAITGTTPPSATIETGSIPPKAEIVFGEAVVTRTGAQEMAVQLAVGPSLQAVRQSWEELSERYGLLAALRPRVVAPRAEGGTYRLLAGPLPSKADAQRICSQLGVGSKACFATQFSGAPL